MSREAGQQSTPTWNYLAMPDMQTAMQDLGAWLAANAFAVALIFVLLLIGFRGARPFIHNVLVRAIKAQQATIGDGETERRQTERRVATIEDLLNKLIRFGVWAGIVAVILGIFDLWSVLASFGIVVAALAFAGQAIILDYIMGVLILIEGQYFEGPGVVSVNLVEGTVEEVGVRRTLIRDPRGTLHSVSNGLIRQSANFTRTYAPATIDIDGVADKDVETVISILNEVGAALVADETIGPLLPTRPATLRPRGYRPAVPHSGSRARCDRRRVPRSRPRSAAGSPPRSPRRRSTSSVRAIGGPNHDRSGHAAARLSGWRPHRRRGRPVLPPDRGPRPGVAVIAVIGLLLVMMIWGARVAG